LGDRSGCRRADAEKSPFEKGGYRGILWEIGRRFTWDNPIVLGGKCLIERSFSPG
jgi:hypothetical protein